MYRQTTISAATIITKSVVRTLEIIAMGRVLDEFADIGMALQDAITVVVSTEVIVTAVVTNVVASPFVLWVQEKLKLTVVLGQLTVDVILTVTDVTSAT